MKLTVKQRLVILGLLPAEGDYKTYKYLQTFKENVAFTEAEQNSLKFKNDKGKMTWVEHTPGKFMTRDIEIPGVIERTLKEILTNLEEKKKISSDNIDLYEIFVIGEKAAELGGTFIPKIWSGKK